MKTAHFKFKIVAVAVLMSGFGLFAGSLNAAAAAPALPTATPATNALSTGATQAVQTATNALPGTNIFSGPLTLTNGALSSTATVFTVPAGKRLVIQFVSGVATLTSSQVLLSLTVDGLQTIPYFTGNRPDNTAIFVVSQKLRDFVGSGQSVVVSAERSNSYGEGTWFVNVIGELEDAPGGD